MTDEEITLCEVLFTCIDRNLIDDNLIQLFYNKIKNTEMEAYVTWLVYRWPSLRKHSNHFPKRFEACTNEFFDASKLRDQKKFDASKLRDQKLFLTQASSGTKTIFRDQKNV